MNHSRRDLLKLGAAALAFSFLPMPALAAKLSSSKPTGQRRIALFNTHTRESIDICFYDRGAYDFEALDRINHILRDHRTQEVQTIDLGLVETLSAVMNKTGSDKPFHIISGFRSSKTNAMLRRKTRGVAQTSYHTLGKAIDIRLPGYSTRRLRNRLVGMRFGGVGYYRRSNFVHIDSGPVRAW